MFPLVAAAQRQQVHREELHRRELVLSRYAVFGMTVRLALPIFFLLMRYDMAVQVMYAEVFDAFVFVRYAVFAVPVSATISWLSALRASTHAQECLVLRLV